MFLSLAEFKKERAFSCTSFRKKKLLNSKRESTRSYYRVWQRRFYPYG
jgi:hypothetical protein